VVTTALAPVGIAYAVASGLPGACGLYATIVPLLAYALFGPSRILVLGPDSPLAAIILGVVGPLAAGDASRAVALAGLMAVVSGAVCIPAGVARLGFVTDLLSKPIRYGYMNGIALAVLVSQTPKLIGVKVEDAGPLRDLWSIGTEIAGGRVNWVAFALGAATLATILSVRSFKGTPSVLIAVIGATAAVQVFGLETWAHVSVLGPRTQLTGVVGALAVALLLLVAPRLLKDLPNAALAAVVIASAIGLFEVSVLKRALSDSALGILVVHPLFRRRRV
jgi:MFS superfamily sulfate permease-like transporter